MARVQHSHQVHTSLLLSLLGQIVWCLFLFWFLAASSLCTGEIICQCTNSSCKLYAELRVSVPVFKSGSNLTASCSILQATGEHCNFTARDIFFKYLGKRIDSKFVTVINETTAKLNVPGLRRVDSGAHMYCFVEGYVSRLSSGNQLPMNVGQVVIQIADRPKKPRFTGCTVYNWLSMNCTWKPATQNTGIETKQTLYWTIIPDHGIEYCPIQHDGSCIWPSVEDMTHLVQPYRRDFVYYLTIEAENLLGTSYVRTTVRTRYKVKPDAVKIYTITRHKRSILISWFSPVPKFLPQYRLLYNIQVTRLNDLDQSSTNITASNETVIYRIDRLIPYTEYLIVIRCIPYIDDTGKGFWSETANFTVWTKPDVPGAVPKVAPGGFRVLDEDNNQNHEVVVYWQAIPPQAAHGRDLVTRIQVFEFLNLDHISCAVSNPVLEKKTDAYSYKLMLHKHKIYAVCIDACNEVGYNTSSKLQPVVIHLEKQESTSLDFYAERHDNEITITWAPVHKATSYTVFWCKSSAYYFCHKEHQLAWEYYPTSTNHAKLTFPATVTYQSQVIAMSAEYLDDHGRPRTTGMHVTDCIFDAEKDPVLPSDIEIPDNQYVQSAVIVKWKKPKCDMTGYIKYFKLIYCKKSKCAQTETFVTVPIKGTLNGQFQQYIIHGLDTDDSYLVKLASVGDNKTSPYSHPFVADVPKQGLTVVHHAVLGIVTFIFVVLLVAGVVFVSRHLYEKCWKKIPVSLPETYPYQVDPERNLRIVDNDTSEEDEALVDGYTGPKNVKRDENQSLLSDEPNPHSDHSVPHSDIENYIKVSNNISNDLDNQSYKQPEYVLNELPRDQRNSCIMLYFPEVSSDSQPAVRRNSQTSVDKTSYQSCQPESVIRWHNNGATVTEVMVRDIRCWSMDHETPSPGSSQSDHCVLSSGVASDCSSGAEVFTHGLVTGTDVQNDAENWLAQAPEQQTYDSDEAADHSQVTDSISAAQEALLGGIQEDNVLNGEVPVNKETTKILFPSEPDDQLPKCKYDSGISTASIVGSPENHPSICNGTISPYIDHDALVDMVT